MRAFGRVAFGGLGDLGGQALGGRVDLGERASVERGDFGGRAFGQQGDLGGGAFGGRALVRGTLAGLRGGEVAIVGAGTWMGVSRVVAAAVAHRRTSVACHIRMIGGGIVVAFGDCNIGYSVAGGVGGQSMLATHSQAAEELASGLSGLHSPAVAVAGGRAVARGVLDVALAVPPPLLVHRKQVLLLLHFWGNRRVPRVVRCYCE